MHYSILHISDIHKHKDVAYDSLIQSLERDLFRYTEAGIAKPSFIVVSGDIIEGAYDDDIIREQYSEAEDFLTKICDLFLDSDKRRILIVPGNHDMNRNRSQASMSPSASDRKEDYVDYFSGSKVTRWSWKDYRFYHIVDWAAYNDRFSLFVEFYNRFYDGIRSFPVDPVNQALFEKFDDYKVSFSCFNSCCSLDHLCHTGGISDDAIISIGHQLSDCYNSGFLNIGVWHHHFYGMPLETNYIDRSFLNTLLDYNVHIGLYGHQHYAQVAEEYSDLLTSSNENSKRILLLSSGTLFGGNKELPYGCRRQYNIIEINNTNGVADITINIREDTNQLNNKLPYWQAKALYNATNSIQYKVLTKKLDLRRMILEIDQKCKFDSDYISACEKLKNLGLDNYNVYNLFLEYLKEIKDYEYVYKNIIKIDSVKEGFLKVISAQQIGNLEYIKEVLSDSRIKSLNDHYINEILKVLKEKL